MNSKKYNEVIAESSLEYFKEGLKNPRELEESTITWWTRLKFSILHIWEWIKDYWLIVFLFSFQITLIPVAIKFGWSYEMLPGMGFFILLILGLFLLIPYGIYEFFKIRKRRITAVRKSFPKATGRQAMRIISILNKSKSDQEKLDAINDYMRRTGLRLMVKRKPNVFNVKPKSKQWLIR
jgi:hypothetical protein